MRRAPADHRWCRLPVVSLAVLLGAGCSKSSGALDAARPEAGAPLVDALTTTEEGGAGGPCARRAAPTVVKLSTDDGLTLEADYYGSGAARGPAAVLLHMVPPTNDRTNFPAAFIEALTAAGIAVLNVDRRGAGKSEGVAQDAYQGPNGKLDAKAAFDFLRGHACPVDADRLYYLGASNGTTTALDFTVYAKDEPAAALPAGLVFLTGGSYTENQNKIADHVRWLAQLPTLFVYATAEREWSVALQEYRPSVWRYKEYDGGGHGSEVLTAKPRSIDDIVEFLTGLQQ